MKPQRMQATLHQIHQHQHPNRTPSEDREPNKRRNKTMALNRTHNRHIQKHLINSKKNYLGQLPMSQRQSPESQVTCGVRN
jgi:hypothetical protein